MLAQRCFLVVVIGFLLVSCKDELTLPTKVHFDFGMETFQKEDPAKGGYVINSPNGYSIEGGELSLDAIEFDGRRNQGKDVFFISSFPESVVSQLESQTSNVNIYFDIPQGEYNRVDVTLHLVNGASAPFKLQGRFLYGQSNSIPIHFEYTYTDEITIRAKPKVGTNIILSREKESNALVVVDAEFLFRFLNPSVIANAARVSVGGEEVILIDHQNNVGIFNQVASRLKNSISVVFE